MRLKDFKIGTRVRSLTADAVAAVEAVTWLGDQTVEVIFDAARARRSRSGEVNG